MLLAFRKINNGLRPCDPKAEALMFKIADGDLVLVEIKRPRNAKFHRLYWALVGKIFDNLDDDRKMLYPSEDDLHEAIKICVGLRHRIEMPTGEVAYRAGSIAFHKMDEDGFREFYDRVCDAVCKYYLPGVDVPALKNEIAMMVGSR